MSEENRKLEPRVFASTSEQEPNKIFSTYGSHESSDSKKRISDEELEGEEEQVRKRKKVLQQHGIPDIKAIKHPLAINNCDGYKNDEDGDPTSFFNRLNRDSATSCLVHLSRSDYCAVASVNRIFRSMIRSGEVYHLRRQQGFTEHWVYFSCSALEWDAYDPYRERWIKVPKMPSSPTDSFAFSDKESLAVGTELLVFGREVTSYVVLKYSILTNSWSPGVVMNSPRCLFGSASLREKAIVAGGTNGHTTLCSAELYNSETHTWETLPAMNKARKMCSGVFMDGKFYVIGGMTNDNEVLKCGEEYDLKRRSWRLIPNMSAGLNGAKGAPPLVAVVNNELFAAHYADKEVMKYNKKNNTWSTLGKLPERFVSMNGWGLAFRACGERLIVIGGQQGSYGGMVELNSWIPNGGPPEWNVIASKRLGSFVFNCAIMGC